MINEEFNFGKAIEMLRSTDSATYEDGYQWLIGQLDNNLDEIIQLLCGEQDPSMRGKLIELLGHSKDDRVIPLLEAELSNPSYEVRAWAYSSLHSFPAAVQIIEKFRREHPHEEFL